ARLGITRYAIYVHDYGAPIGWRLALSDAKAITAIVSQNGNAYEDGFVESFWESIWAYAERQDAETERALRPALSQQAIRWQYLTGVPDPTLVDPTTWRHDAALIARPGNDLIQLRLFRDYASNRPLYPRLQEYFRSSQVPLLALWGRGDEIFGPAGAEAFARDLPEARIELWDTGHFLLETHLNEAAATIREILGDAVGRGRAEGAPTAGHSGTPPRQEARSRFSAVGARDPGRRAVRRSSRPARGRRPEGRSHRSRRGHRASGSSRRRRAAHRDAPGCGARSVRRSPLDGR